MNRPLKCVITAFLLLFAQGAPLFCQVSETNWKELLDKYELICLKCIDLKERKADGEEISSRQMLSLVDEIRRLRYQIRAVDDKMPAAARKRFYDIRKMYSTGIVTDTSIPQLEIVSTPIVPGFEFTKRPCPIASVKPLPTTPRRPKPVWILSASVNLPQLAFGPTAQYWGNRFGAWAAFRSTFSFHRPAYSARSNGSSGDNRIWTTGKAATDRLFATAGPLIRLKKNFAVFGGAGYGVKQLRWEDNNGDWIKIEDLSSTGICCEIGATARISSLAVSLSWFSLAQDCNCATVALGYCF